MKNANTNSILFRALIDWKCKTKAKASQIKQEIVKTGGGPANYVPLSDAEKRLLSLMGTKSVQGDDVCEMGFGQHMLQPTVLDAAMLNIAAALFSSSFRCVIPARFKLRDISLTKLLVTSASLTIKEINHPSSAEPRRMSGWGCEEIQGNVSRSKGFQELKKPKDFCFIKLSVASPSVLNFSPYREKESQHYN
ncbi:unnamed protein product [Acanthoscelides obtectus]|uniref:Uncharacterized protein n=1 Tax=Acanthoscelides obtectus TaxID=200917 RepID=A0A9P0KU97_ACAOB|nr:unnamed protein product [Acanthoscelides obtectus]CAK1674553.1 hypothetical protein AOBTE_LOCUS29656 [Acanthoscelides obtectus]